MKATELNKTNKNDKCTQNQLTWTKMKTENIT